jgi:GTPase SAR1 family protein
MKSKIEATGHRFFACSALSQDNLNSVFTEAIREMLTARSRLRQKQKKEEESNCCLI